MVLTVGVAERPTLGFRYQLLSWKDRIQMMFQAWQLKGIQTEKTQEDPEVGMGS